jgi:hypothetical protein
MKMWPGVSALMMQQVIEGQDVFKFPDSGATKPFSGKAQRPCYSSDGDYQASVEES